jgi:hypothetical protein
VETRNGCGEMMPKFYFSVKTRNRQQVDGIQIYGQDYADAERKLRQMYHECEVTEYKIFEDENKFSRSLDIENILTLISKESDQ